MTDSDTMNARERRLHAKTEEEVGRVLDEFSEQLSRFELALIVARNSFDQWVARCGAAADMKGYSPFDLLVLHMVDFNSRPKRVADICFGLKVEETHLVSYALKKLGKAGLVESRKDGKETFFVNTPEGAEIIKNYKEVRKRHLVRALTMFSSEELNVDELADTLWAFTGIYEQAARAVETSL